MATPQSAGSTLAVHERTGRTTHDRDVLRVSQAPHVPDGPRPNAAHAPHVPNAPHPMESTAPHANKALPHHTGSPGDRTAAPRTHAA